VVVPFADRMLLHNVLILAALWLHALMLLVGQQEGLLACKNYATTTPKSLLLGTGLIWSKLSRSNTGKKETVKQQLSVSVFLKFYLKPTLLKAHIPRELVPNRSKTAMNH